MKPNIEHKILYVCRIQQNYIMKNTRKKETIDGVHIGWGCVALRFFVISSNTNKQLSSKIKCSFSFVFNEGSNIF